MQILRAGGLVSVMAYTGHPDGREEAQAVQAAFAALPPGAWVTSRLQLLNREGAPLLLCAFKL